MILPDVNLLVYAYNVDAPRHAEAKTWWEDAINAQRPVGLPWAVIFGYIRLMTHPAVLERPLRPQEALDDVRAWLDRPDVQVLEPGPRHLVIAANLFTELGVAGSLTTDVHLAAIAIEHQCELCSNDMDFQRFPGLRWTNPISSARK